MGRKFGVLLHSLILLGLFSTQAFSQDKKEVYEGYWKEANLTFEEVQRHVRPETCARSSQIYYGCYSAVAFLAANLNTEAVLKLKNSPKEVWETTVIESFTNYEIRAINKTKLPKKYTFQERLQNIEEEKQERTKIFALASNTTAVHEIVDILDWTQSRVKTEKLSKTISQAVQSFYIYGIDAHSHLHTEKELDDMMRPNNTEKVVGIGASLILRGDLVEIVGLPKNSPAKSAGLKRGDNIIAVNKVSVASQDLEKTINLIRGQENTNVIITVLRKNKSLDFTITRRSVVFENIETEVVKAQDGKKALYFRLASFSERGLCEKFVDHLKQGLATAKVDRLIIDLRGNGGGLLNEVLCMAGSLYTQNAPLLKIWDLQNKSFEQTYSYKDGAISGILFGRAENISHLVKNKSLVVLTDAGSASASEIFAGIIQDQQLGITVGERSYGKGTVQTPQEYVTLNNVNLQMFRTISRFHLPSGRTNQISGISPDVEVYNNPNPTEEDKFAMREKELYPHAVEPAQNNYSTPVEVKARAESCLARVDLKKTYEKLSQESDYVDYQLLAATELATCL